MICRHIFDLCFSNSRNFYSLFNYINGNYKCPKHIFIDNSVYEQIRKNGKLLIALDNEFSTELINYNIINNYHINVNFMVNKCPSILQEKTYEIYKKNKPIKQKKLYPLEYYCQNYDDKDFNMFELLTYKNNSLDMINNTLIRSSIYKNYNLINYILKNFNITDYDVLNETRINLSTSINLSSDEYFIDQFNDIKNSFKNNEIFNYLYKIYPNDKNERVRYSNYLIKKINKLLIKL